jgi:hypothetical protein
MLRIADSSSTVILYDSIFEPASVTKFNRSKNQTIFHDVTNRYDYNQSESRKWFGADSQKEYEDRLKFGWGEGVDKLREIATKEIQPTSLRKKRVRADQGDELDIHAVYRGDLSKAWSKTKRQHKLGGMRSIALVCNLSCNAGEDAKNLFYRGASVLKLAEALSEAGYSVAIYGATASSDVGSTHFKMVQVVEIKAEDHALDTSTLASLIAMPAYKRVKLHGAMLEECDRRNVDAHAGLGSNASDLIVKEIKKLPISDNAFIQPEVNSKESAERWIDSVMSKIEPQQFEGV